MWSISTEIQDMDVTKSTLINSNNVTHLKNVYSEDAVIASNLSLIETVFSGQTFQWQTYQQIPYSERNEENTGVAYRVLNPLESPTGKPEIMWIVETDPTTMIYGTAKELTDVVDSAFYNLDSINPDQEITSFLSHISVTEEYESQVPNITLVTGFPTTTLYEFICSQQMSLDRIYSLNQTLRETFGSTRKLFGKTHSAFPTPNQITRHGSIEQLNELKLGYRSKYIYNTSTQLVDEDPKIPETNAETTQTRDTLKQFYGVGDKIADCTLLYGYGDLSVVPIDTWMKQYVDSNVSTTCNSYEEYQTALTHHLRDSKEGLDQLYLFYLLSSGVLSPSE